MKRSIPIISAALLLSASALAQNLNPVVEVTNTYEGRLSDIHKPDQLLSIPDSVTRFKLDFDYSVFEKPYKGAYEFSPYMVSMRPESSPEDITRFYLKAGAGYTLRPELTFVWNPVLKKGFSANVHTDFNSYIGKYRDIGPVQGEDAILLKSTGSTQPGRYLRGGLGTDLGYAWRTGKAGVSLDYVKQLDNYPLQRNYDGFIVNPTVRSTDPDASLYYDASFKYRIGRDRVVDMNPVDEYYSELAATVGPSLGASDKLLVDLSLVTDNMSGYGSGGHLILTPRYVHQGKRLDWTAGVRFAVLFNAVSEEAVLIDGQVPYFGHRGQKLFPEARVSFRIFQEYLSVYASATGGPKLHTYGSILESNRYFSAGRQADLLYYFPFDHSIERLNLQAGIKGNILKRLQWDLSGGYAFWDHALLDGFHTGLSDALPVFYGKYAYSDMKVGYADLKLLFDTKNIDVDGLLSFKQTSSLEDNLFAPAKLSGDVRAAYDWNGRIKGGVTANFATGRTGHYTYSQSGGATVTQTVRIPGYVDLGVFGEYSFNRRWGVWAQAGNLLNQTIQRVPFYAENGVYFTAGICLNIQ